MALDFVQLHTEVVKTLDRLTTEEINNLDRVNDYDFLFMMVDASFLALFSYKLGATLEQPAIKNMVWLVGLVVAGDFLENIMMLKITSLFTEGAASFSPFTSFLPLFTWTKWALLAAIFTGVGIPLIQRGFFSKALSLPLLLPGILLALSIVDYFSWINRFTASIFLSFIFLVIFTVCYKKPEMSQPD